MGSNFGGVAICMLSLRLTGHRADLYLHLDGEEVHIAILLQEFPRARQVLVGCAHDVQDGQQLPEAHGKVFRHPAASGDRSYTLGRLAGIRNLTPIIAFLRSMAQVKMTSTSSATLRALSFYHMDATSVL